MFCSTFSMGSLVAVSASTYIWIHLSLWNSFPVPRSTPSFHLHRKQFFSQKIVIILNLYQAMHFSSGRLYTNSLLARWGVPRAHWAHHCLNKHAAWTRVRIFGLWTIQFILQVKTLTLTAMASSTPQRSTNRLSRAVFLVILNIR